MNTVLLTLSHSNRPAVVRSLRSVTMRDVLAARFRHEQACRRCAKGIGCYIGRELDSLEAGTGVHVADVVTR